MTDLTGQSPAGHPEQLVPGRRSPGTQAAGDQPVLGDAAPADHDAQIEQASGRLQAALQRARQAVTPPVVEPLAAPDSDVVTELEQVHRELREMLDRAGRG